MHVAPVAHLFKWNHHDHHEGSNDSQTIPLPPSDLYPFSRSIRYQVHGKCGSVRARLIPAPRGSGIVGSPVMKMLAGHWRARGGRIWMVTSERG